MLRVIQWATGSVGRHAAAAVYGHPDLELVGAFVYSDAKARRDVGDICGIGETGVVATDNPDDIVALDADCVLYMPQGEMNPMGAVDDICRLLTSGKNVGGGRDRSGLPWHRDARRTRDRAGVCGCAGNPHLP